MSAIKSSWGDTMPCARVSRALGADAASGVGAASPRTRGKARPSGDRHRDGRWRAVGDLRTVFPATWSTGARRASFWRMRARLEIAGPHSAGPW